MSAPTQRPYQLAASDAIEAAFFDQQQNRLLVKKPTGTGKTVWFAGLLARPRIAAWLEGFVASHTQRGAKMLVIAHREELLDQAAEKIQKANPGTVVTVEQGDRYASPYSDVVIASIQTLSAAKFRRLKRLLARHTFRIVVVDEAHHAAAPSYRTALVHLGFLPASDASDADNVEAVTHEDVAEMEHALAGWDAIAPRDRLLLGVTATPKRSDAIGLGCVFQSIAYSYALKAAIDDGWLVPIVPWVVESQESLDHVRTTAGEFNQKDLAAAVNLERRNKLAVSAWQAYAPTCSTIAFTVDVAHAHAVAEEFVRAGVEAVAISGETPKDDRRNYLAAYQAGRVQLISNCMVLTEGTDLPRTGCILHLKPTQSATLYEQMTGRGLRLFPDKEACIVIDVVDIARRHSLQTAPVLYGLPPSLLSKGKDLRQLEEDVEAFLERHPGFEIEDAGRMTLDELEARAATFDIWTVPELGAFGAGRALNWIKVGEEDYRLQYPWADGTEVLAVSRDILGHYDVSLTLRPREGTVRQRTIATQIASSDAAAGLAEAFVLQERRSVMKLKAPDAPWRARPASPKQRQLLARLRVPTPATLTMGEASNLIDLAKARKG